ncbi:MAG: hypothetical protein LQ342_002515 [Letrouitia transgressa]|nr:MAG: hypothetical protein LQ342_002515 [Letrouitia transgressa]
MDSHSRYRTEVHGDVVARFNERFVLSLGTCESCLFVDDELNVLPISGGKNVKPLPPPSPKDEGKTKTQEELRGIKDSLVDTRPLGLLVQLARTVEQAKALLTFVDAIAEKTLRSTVTLTAARGRGKSAALGLAIAAAIAHGYSNIFITSPSPENLKTLFEFVFKGFDALQYQDHLDYNIIQSTNPDFKKAIVRVNIYRQHRQTIQYIQPQDAYTLGQAELLVIDEAAAIPLPFVKKLMGPYLVFMASTINGYEGTGRSLSLKLIQQLREQSSGGGKGKPNDASARNGDMPNIGGRTLREITLSEPIRYAQGDAVEKWLNSVLCLDATLPTSIFPTLGSPHPSKCELLHVNRDTLFSFHPVSEKFLQQMIALYVASHYKNSPNDLQLMSDAPAHQLYVLVPPIDSDSPRLPEPLCVVQLALEGQISKSSVHHSLARGKREDGDLIPWVVSQQFQDEEFAGLSGARVIRIATKPEYIGMGYGSQALKLLIDFFEGKFTGLSESEPSTVEEMVRVSDAELEKSTLLSDDVKVRDIHNMPPLFSKLSDCRPQTLDYLGVSFGLTSPLHKFWKRSSFAPVCLGQTPNELTGEHSCVMLRTLSSSAQDTAWLGAFARDFHKRFLSLLSYQFRVFPSDLALSINESANTGAKLDSSVPPRPLTKPVLNETFSPFDLKRLDSYANKMIGYHFIIDMVPQIAFFYFTGRLSLADPLTGVQRFILLAIGLQKKTLDDVEKELKLPASQVLVFFLKIIRKVSSRFRDILTGAVTDAMPDPISAETTESRVKVNIREEAPIFPKNLEEDLREGEEEVDRDMKEKRRALIDALPLDQYEVETGGTGWEEAEKQVQRAVNSKGDKGNVTVSVRSARPAFSKRKSETAEEIEKKEAKRLKKTMKKAK